MKHSQDIQDARNHLNLVNMLDGETVDHVDEGFFVLEEIAASGDRGKSIAENLGRTYMNKFREIVKEKLSHKSIPEPQLEALLKTVIALEASIFSEGLGLGALRQDVASRLIDVYFQGYSQAEKEQEIRALMNRMEKEGSQR